MILIPYRIYSPTLHIVVVFPRPNLRPPMAPNAPYPDPASTESERERSHNVTADSNTSEQRVYLTGVKLFSLLGSLTLVTFLVLLDTSILGTAIPHITTEFRSLHDVGWYVGAYTLAA